MKFKKTAALLSALVMSVSAGNAFAYTAKSGDTYWKISQNYGVSLKNLLDVNGKSMSSSLNVGDAVLIPGIDVHIAVAGDTYWKISQRYGIDFYTLLSLNGATDTSWLSIGQVVKIKGSNTAAPSASTSPYVTYITYKTKSGDDLWTLSEKFGIPYTELCDVNNMGDSTVLYDGTAITVPVHHVPVTYAPSGYGENLDWWTQAQYVIPIGSVFTVVDLNTGKTFRAKRTIGANHADCEPMSAADTATMKAIWGGVFSWSARPVLIKYNGRTIAASAASYEHAGNDWDAGGAWTSWRSGDYGAGENYDFVKGNNYNGHFDIYFSNCTSHNTGATSAAHQANINTAAGK